MATVAERLERRPHAPDALSGTPRAHGLDRWIFVFMAAWYIAVTLTGFIPDSIMKIELVRAGARPDFPFALHVHAVLMGAFLSLLLVQTWLVATGRHGDHARLGVGGFVLACAVVAGGVLLVPINYHVARDWLQIAPMHAQPELLARISRLETNLLRQLSVGLLFTLFMAIAFRARAKDSGLHKRMIFLAAALPMSAAWARVPFLPSSLPQSTISADLYTLATIAPLFVWDVLRNRRIHKAYWIWLAACLPLTALVHALRDTPWWHATARQIMGV